MHDEIGRYPVVPGPVIAGPAGRVAGTRPWNGSSHTGNAGTGTCRPAGISLLIALTGLRCSASGRDGTGRWGTAGSLFPVRRPVYGKRCLVMKMIWAIIGSGSVQWAIDALRHIGIEGNNQDECRRQPDQATAPDTSGSGGRRA